jgi:heme exporter protein A
LSHRLEIIDLTCARGDRPLFAGLAVTLGAGELLHVVGGNGAGKTTLLRTLCGLSRPAAGQIRWAGEPIEALGDEYRHALAYLGHTDGVQGDLTPAENLGALACLSGRPHDSKAIAAALERMGLAASRRFPAKILSQGQKRRLGLARLLVLEKPLWILDEPFTALDAGSSRLMLALLREQLARGGLVTLSSHHDFDLPGVTVRRVDLDALRTRYTAGRLIRSTAVA